MPPNQATLTSSDRSIQQALECSQGPTAPAQVPHYMLPRNSTPRQRQPAKKADHIAHGQRQTPGQKLRPMARPQTSSQQHTDSARTTPHNARRQQQRNVAPPGPTPACEEPSTTLPIHPCPFTAAQTASEAAIRCGNADSASGGAAPNASVSVISATEAAEATQATQAAARAAASAAESATRAAAAAESTAGAIAATVACLQSSSSNRNHAATRETSDSSTKRARRSRRALNKANLSSRKAPGASHSGRCASCRVTSI